MAAVPEAFWLDIHAHLCPVLWLLPMDGVWSISGASVVCMFLLERCWILNKIAGLGPRMTCGKLENCIMQKKSLMDCKRVPGILECESPKNPGWWCSITEEKGKTICNKSVIYDCDFLCQVTVCRDCCSQEHKEWSLCLWYCLLQTLIDTECIRKEGILGGVFHLKTQRQKEAGASSFARTCCCGALRCLSTAPGLTFQQVSYWWSNTWQCIATFFFQLLFSFTISIAQLKVFLLSSAALPFIFDLSSIFFCGFSISSMFSVAENLIKMADLKKIDLKYPALLQTWW